MRQPHQAGALALTVAGAVLIAAGSVALTVWATEYIFAALREMAYGGLASILGPWMIAISIMAAAFAAAGAVGSWRTLRTGGRRAGGAVIGGLCVALGIGIMFGSHFQPDRSAFVLALAGAGLSVEIAGGWLSGWGTR
jgi:hypothetical protein